MTNNTILRIAILGLITCPCLAQADEESSFFDGGWRISAGAVYDSGVKVDMHFTPQQTYATPFARSPGALSKKQAEADGKGTKSGTRTTYVKHNADGTTSTSWIDSNDNATGYEAGKTRYYSLAEDAWGGGGSFTVGQANYEELEVNQESFGSMARSARDDGAMPGVNIQLSRNLYHDEENSWGVEAAIAVQYARRNNVFKSASNWKIGSSTYTTGYYSTRYTDSGLLGELLSYDGTADEKSLINEIVWGNPSRGYTGLGPNDERPTDPDAIAANIPISSETEDDWGESSSSDTQYGSLYAKGDYDNLELMLLLQPYYDVCDWFSVNATFGMVVSRQSMDMTFAMLRNGALEYTNSSDFSQWDVYGIAGLGAMFYYEGFTLSGDFMARFLDRDMDISDRYYHGTVERGNWLFRLGLGYEF